ncbi:hypothetical protein HYT84_02525 [Candidatus Micrarchaeota archaeon]|nr:hypothetical protein [Candidatus Micrarchaeota archaeon]
MGSILFFGQGSEACANILSMMYSDLYPLSGIAALITGLVVAASYMFGEATQNPKVVTWSKTEFIQLFISAISVIFILQLVTGICQFYVLDLAALTPKDVTFQSTITTTTEDGTVLKVPMTIFDGAMHSLLQSANYSRDVMKIQRYHLGAFNMLQARGRWDCEIAICLFGNNGISYAPYTGLTTISTAFNFTFNSALLSYLSALNYLLILFFAYKGMALFLIPLGIFLRSMPYLRGLGTLFISVPLCFMVVYPFLLVAGGFVSKDLMVIPSDLQQFTKEGYLASVSKSGADLDVGEDDYIDDILDPGGNGSPTINYTGALSLAGRAFIVAVFFPTIALLGTIASIRQVGRLLGEEIDLSRIIQMV